MRRSAKQWLWLIVVLGGIGALLILRKSEADGIRDDLESIAGALRFEGQPPKPSWVATLRSRLAAHLANPATISVSPIGEASYAVDSLVEAILEYASLHAGVRVTLSHVGVKIDPNGKRATAKGDVLLEVTEPSAERRGEPRHFVVTFEKNTDAWIVVHAQISSPQIDQPEARP